MTGEILRYGDPHRVTVRVVDPGPPATSLVHVVTMDRPERKNAFDQAMYHALVDALSAADSDPAVAAVVLTGAGDVFTSGQDLDEMAAIATSVGAGDPGEAPGTTGFTALLDLLATLTTPVLAAVNGAGIGLGFTILAHVDVVVMAASARCRAPFALLGVPPEAASSVLFPMRMGPARASEALLSARWFGADELVACGFANEAAPDGGALDAALARAAEMAAFPPGAPARVKALMQAGTADLVAATRAREDRAFAELFADPAANPGDSLTSGLGRGGGNG